MTDCVLGVVVVAQDNRCSESEEWSELGDRNHCPFPKPPEQPWFPESACACKSDYYRHYRSKQCVHLDECPIQCEDSNQIYEKDEAPLYCVPTCDTDPYFPFWSCRYCSNCPRGMLRLLNGCVAPNQCKRDCERGSCAAGFLRFRGYHCVPEDKCTKARRPPLPTKIGNNPVHKIWGDNN